MRCLELRLASSTVGATAIIGPGAWWISVTVDYESDAPLS
jgi:hypothetical protein